MTEPQKTTSWWQTLPGALTALAAVLTATTGLVALLMQNGVFGGKTDTSAQPTQSHPKQAASSSAANGTTTVARSNMAAKSWSDTTAVVTTSDGSRTRVRASSLSNCISVDHQIEFEAGQSIPFEKMAGFEVLQADDHTSPSAKAKLKVELRDGTVISGSVAGNCDLFGYNELGRFSTTYDRLHTVRFE